MMKKTQKQTLKKMEKTLADMSVTDMKLIINYPVGKEIFNQLPNNTVLSLKVLQQYIENGQFVHVCCTRSPLTGKFYNGIGRQLIIFRTDLEYKPH